MKRYFIKIDGKQIEVTKEISDEVRANSGASRHERYVIFELAPKHELSLESLNTHEFPVEIHMVDKLKTTEDIIFEHIQRRALQDALDQLTLEEIQLIVAIYFEGLNERTIAQYMECSQSTVWHRKQKVLKKLKKLLTFSINYA